MKKFLRFLRGVIAIMRGGVMFQNLFGKREKSFFEVYKDDNNLKLGEILETLRGYVEYDRSKLFQVKQLCERINNILSRHMIFFAGDILVCKDLIDKIQNEQLDKWKDNYSDAKRNIIDQINKMAGEIDNIIKEIREKLNSFKMFDGRVSQSLFNSQSNGVERQFSTLPIVDFESLRQNYKCNAIHHVMVVNPNTKNILENELFQLIYQEAVSAAKLQYANVSALGFPVSGTKSEFIVAFSILLGILTFLGSGMAIDRPDGSMNPYAGIGMLVGLAMCFGVPVVYGVFSWISWHFKNKNFISEETKSFLARSLGIFGLSTSTLHNEDNHTDTLNANNEQEKLLSSTINNNVSYGSNKQLTQVTIEVNSTQDDVRTIFAPGDKISLAQIRPRSP